LTVVPVFFFENERYNPGKKQIQAIAGNPNVYCRASGLVIEADWRNWRESDFKAYLDVVFEAFCRDRIMFGSDWPVCLLGGEVRKSPGAADQLRS
jgi:L-fuconolactonase